jgi:hypothetical protein
LGHQRLHYLAGEGIAKSYIEQVLSVQLVSEIAGCKEIIVEEELSRVTALACSNPKETLRDSRDAKESL